MTRSELADAMLKGKDTPGVREDKMAPYVAVSPRKFFCRACALGCALIGFFNGDYEKAEAYYDAENMQRETDESVYDIFADYLKISAELALEIELKHLNGMPIQQIAAWLKTSEQEATTNG